MRNRTRLLVLLCTCFLVTTGAKALQDEPAQRAKVTNVQHPGGLKDRVVLTVENLQTLVDEAGNNKIVPFIDGLPLKGVPTNRSKSDQLAFQLKPTPAESLEAWALIVQRRDGFTTSNVGISVGVEDGTPILSDASMTLKFVSVPWLLSGVVVVALFAIAFFWLAGHSDIIRDYGPEPPGGARKPFSIGRTQMAVWLFLVIGSYLFIFAMTGELDSITPSVLGLIGISSGTAFSSTVIDAGKRSTATAGREKLTAEQTALQTGIQELEDQISKAAPADKAALQTQLDTSRARLNEVGAQLSQGTAAPVEPRVTKGFLRDLVSDKTGVSFHRFQILAWTIVLALIFLAEVGSKLIMPSFSATLLGLMGISSGTYIGFKFPEQQ